MTTPIAREIKLANLRKIASGEMTCKEAAKELGVSPTSIYEWRKQLESKGEGAMPGKGFQSPDEAELRKLREKVKQLEAENAFLRKAAKYFAAE